jgi:hypothetical protein
MLSWRKGVQRSKESATRAEHLKKVDELYVYGGQQQQSQYMMHCVLYRGHRHGGIASRAGVASISRENNSSWVASLTRDIVQPPRATGLDESNMALE